MSKKLTKTLAKGPLKIDEELLKKRIMFFHGEVSRYTILDAIAKLTYLNGLNDKPIQINLCSEGGSVDSGLALYDLIKSSKAPIHIHCSGLAASMGAILLAAGKKGKRTASSNSRIMIHQPSSGYIGRASDIEVHATETNRIKKLLSQLISQDTGQPFNKVSKDMNQDFWMTAQDALKYGIIDKVI